MRLLLRVLCVSCGCGFSIAVVAAVPDVAHQHTHDASDESRAPAVTSPELLRQLDEVRRATERYRDHERARQDGYELFGTEGPLMGEHWYRPDLVHEPLALDRPSTLQYAVIDGERRLVGVAYTTYRRPTDPMPEGFAGSDDHWHVHDVVKLARAISEGRPVLRWLTENRITRGKMGGGDGRTQLTMLHAWIWLDNPDGMFANDHPVLPYLRAGLPAPWAAKDRLDAARGVALAADGSCTADTRRTNALAQFDRTQRETLTKACEAAARDVRASLDRRDRTADTVNAAAELAWRMLESSRNDLLTTDQKRRLASVVEHDPSHSGHP
jgi:hypothetical protein